MIDEQEFRRQCESALDSLYKALGQASEDHDFDPDMNNGALSISFDDPPGRFVVSPQSPVRQIWVSAHSKSFKFDWNPEAKAFVLPDTKQTLKEMIAAAIGQQIGEKVEL